MKRLQSFVFYSALFATAAASLCTSAFGQEVIKVDPARQMTVAVGNNLVCAGYIQSSAISTANKIVGAQDEADHYNYSTNDFVYINIGHDKGARVGDIFSVVRPRGPVKSKWSRKGDLGFYVQELGALEVVDVKATVSVARVRSSCDSFRLGDLVQLSEARFSPLSERRGALDRFRDPSGKASGRIVMSRDGAEVLARDFVAYVDLGADDRVQVGDHLTVFRPLADGNITKLPNGELASARDYGYQSDAYQGGRFSNQAPRKSGDHATGKEVSNKAAKEGRPSDLRKVVGEAVVINVKEKTATVVIIKTGQEIHTGDWVEIQ
ncbi:MAG TPA: hypothetical protein VGO43_02095 [Pyrinomonadaceae bacterium]|nr:hypothetical protein [Pyrinomonadaceae bacterium]